MDNFQTENNSENIPDNNDGEKEIEDDEVIDPISDIIDYLVRCAKISFKNAHIDATEIKTSDKIQLACKLFKHSPLDFLLQFGKYLAPYHVKYFEDLQWPLFNKDEEEKFKAYVAQLKIYHTDESKHKRIRNRRYRALQKMKEETDYFSEKQMMYRNPLLYEQLVGQYLTDEEIVERDGVDRENLTFLNMILETVDHNEMREHKNKQMMEEDEIFDNTKKEGKKEDSTKKKQWGDFDVPDSTPSFTPEARKQSMISAPERMLLKEEFLQEMYSSFIEGRDVDIDYQDIDSNDQYDDLVQMSQDAEDKYFDSEPNEVENLEDHMKLIEEYGRKKSYEENSTGDDPLDIFMKHISIKHIVD